MKKGFYLIALIVICGFWSCDKNEVNVQPVEIAEASEHLLSFDTYDDYSAERKKVQAMNLEERIQYENSKGFRSFGTQCEQIYFSADLDNMTDDQIREFVNANDEYLELVEEDGEVYLEAKLAKSSDFYLINKDKMFKKGGMTIKVINNNTSVTALCDENIEELMQLNKDNLHRVEGNENFMVNTAERINILKASASGCLKEINKREDSSGGRDRILTHLIWETTNSTSVDGKMYVVLSAKYEIRPYKRTLGIWYWCTRTLSYSAKATLSYHSINSNNSGSFNLNKSELNISSSHREAQKDVWLLASTHTGLFIQFEGYNCWGTSASVRKNAIISCNAESLGF